MSQPQAPIRRIVSLLPCAILAVLFGYGVVSLPGLVERWGVTLAGVLVLSGWVLLASFAMPLIRFGRSRKVIFVLLVAALVLRVAFAALYVSRTPQGDAQSYMTLASSLLAGQGFHIAEPFLGLDTRALFPPLYPLVLAGWGAVAGFSIASLLVLNTAIDLAAAAMLLLLGEWFGNPGAGRGAAWLYLIWPSVLFSAPLAQKEGLCALLVIALAVAWVKAITARRVMTAATIGVLAGLLALTQPGFAPLAGLFGLVLVSRSGFMRLMRTGLLAAPVACLVLLPWWVRNWLVLGAFVPLTSSSGVGLWIGNNPGATGNWMAPPASWRGLPELEYSRRAGAVARAWITAHPADFVRLTLAKFARSCGVGHFGLVRLTAMHPPVSARLTALLLPLSQGAHLLMLGVATIAAWAGRSRASVPLLLVAACGLQAMVFGVWFEFGERHREFATPFLLLLVCAAVEGLRCRSPVEPSVDRPLTAADDEQVETAQEHREVCASLMLRAPKAVAFQVGQAERANLMPQQDRELGRGERDDHGDN